MSVILDIAVSHLRARLRQTLVSLIGIALGAAFFIAVAGLMQGSELDVHKRLVDNSPHITVTDDFRNAAAQPATMAYPDAALDLRSVKPKTEVRGIRQYRQKLEIIAKTPGVRVAPMLSGSAILTFAGQQRGVSLSGVVPDLMKDVSTIDEKFVAGGLDALDANPNGIVIGAGLVQKLGLRMGDNLNIAANTGQVQTLKIVGIFKTGNAHYDEDQSFTVLKRAQALFDRPNIANTFIVKLDDANRARLVARDIENRIGYKAESWQEASQDLESVLLVRNIIMYTVVSAILIVASFGIYNVISTVVFEKTRDIAILKSIGFTPSDVRRVFVIEGVIMGLIGSAMGIILGIGVMRGLELVQVKPPGESDIITLPIYWGPELFAMAVGFAMISATLAAYLPARRGGKVQPVDILRGAI
ncbi:MAG: ABC transporter permease [Sphingomonadales bacterium]|nr:MAG: ABC transporter permease [Sphingomonadales bacterium]